MSDDIVVQPDQRALLSQGKLTELAQRVETQRQQLAEKTKNMNALRQAAKGSNFITAWWNDTDDKLKDGQLDLMDSLSGLQSVSSELLEANATISKVLLAQQDTLLLQQRMLEEQSRRLNEQGDLLEAQQEVHHGKVEEMLESNRELDRASRETMVLAERLMDGIAEVQAAEQRLDAKVANQVEKLSAQVRMLRLGVGLALLVSAGAVLLSFVRA